MFNIYAFSFVWFFCSDEFCFSRFVMMPFPNLNTKDSLAYKRARKLLNLRLIYVSGSRSKCQHFIKFYKQ